MNAYVRYALGICLQIVGLLNAVFLVGVPIWLAGRRLCRDARTDDRSPPLVEHRPTDGDPIRSHSAGIGPSGDDTSEPTHPPESRSERRVPVHRN